MLEFFQGFFNSILEFFNMLGGLVTNIATAFVTYWEFVKTAFPVISLVLGNMPAIILTSAILALILAFINRLTLGVGGG